MLKRISILAVLVAVVGGLFAVTQPASAAGQRLVFSGLVKSNDRNYNFVLPVHKGEKLRFEIEGERAGQPVILRLKRDKHGAFGASDKDVFTNVRNGDVREAFENFEGHGQRMYLKHEAGYEVHVNIYVIE